MEHANYVIDIKSYKHTLTKCNIYCFSTPTVFALKHLIVTLHIHCIFFSVCGNIVIPTLCYSAVCYNERCYNECMIQRRVFINNIRMLQRTRRNAVGRCSTRVHLTCWAFRLWLECQLSLLLWFVRFSYQFILVMCAYLCVYQGKFVYVFIRKSFFMVFTKENLFIRFKFTCAMYKS